MTDTGARSSGGDRLTAMVVTTVLLAVLAAQLGGRGWAVPTRTTTGWQVTDVPAPLAALLLATAAVCLLAAALLTRPARLGWTVGATWWAMTLAAAAALVWNDLYHASLRGPGGIIPVAEWLYGFLPALLVGLLARRRGRAAHLRATLGTGVLTVPMSALGWALSSASGTPAATVGALGSAAVLAAVPLAVAVVLTRARRPEGMAVRPV